MIGATLKVKLSLGFLGNGQMAGYELDVALFAMAAYLAINGSKLLSLNQLISKEGFKEMLQKLLKKSNNLGNQTLNS